MEERQLKINEICSYICGEVPLSQKAYSNLCFELLPWLAREYMAAKADAAANMPDENPNATQLEK